MRALLVAVLAPMLSWGVSCPSGYTYYVPITITSPGNAGSLTNFPVMIAQTFASWKWVTNGGKVQHSVGCCAAGQNAPADLVYGSSTGSLYNWDNTFWGQSTGVINAFVEIPSLGSGTTTFYAFYDDSSVSTYQGNYQSTWDANYLGVWHLPDTAAAPDAHDSTSNANNGTASSTAPVGTSGCILDGCGTFVSASNEYFTLGTAINPSAITLSAWVNATSFPNSLNTPVTRNSGGLSYATLLVNSSGVQNPYVYAGAQLNCLGSHTLSPGTWYLLSLNYDSTNGLISYINGVQDCTTGASGTLATSPTGTTAIGTDTSNAGRNWNGEIDEVRVSNVSRSADWKIAQYNIEKPGSTVVTLGTETACTASAPSNAFSIIQ